MSESMLQVPPMFQPPICVRRWSHCTGWKAEAQAILPAIYWKRGV